jgi:hypothetical protein
MATLTTWTPGESDKKETCPILDDPAPDCYCRTLNSLDVSLAIQFCLSDFKQCPTYKNYMGITDYSPNEGCPVLDNPAPDCYCLSLNSFNVPKIIRFCMKDFKECPIYKKYIGHPQS